MTRTMSGPLAAAHAASPRKGAECAILAAKGGARAAFTTWSSALTVDLGLGAGPEQCLPGMNLSALTLAAGLDANSFEMDGPATGEFAPAKVWAGKWRGADAWLVRVVPGVAGFSPLLAGQVGEPRVEGRRFVLEVRDAADAFNETWGRVLSPWCTAMFGDAQCGAARTPVAAEVVTVTDDFRFAVDLGGAHPDQWFTLGVAEFLTGGLAGAAGARIAGYAGDTAAVELLEPLPALPEPGDTLNLYRECSKLLKSDEADMPTCMTHENAVNFRGWPEVPGSRFYHRVAAPGTNYE